ncbi:shikimate dehydrogenase family protein [Sphingomonas sp.]|uniref:shikimate dehydrogenase family protein n=1 Tax=Sphingomonas sp. TaxID=28214 RepID=UPI003B00E9A5
MSLPWAEVIGDPVAQSKSPVIHGFWLAASGLPGRYDKTRVAGDDLARFLAERRRDSDWRGCNVTVPHKERVVPLLDRLEPQAARIGAVNTVIRDGDALVGVNTDAGGFIDPLREVLGRPHLFRMARVLGTGGAARAIVAALADEGFTIVLAGRDPDKAARLLAELAPDGGHHAVAISHFAEPTDFAFDDRAGCLDLVVNATVLGMIGQPPLAFHISHAPPGSIVYDIVYAPLETRLLRDARARGLPTIDGLAMLIGQAAEAFERFFGRAPPRGRDGELRTLLAA